MWIWLAIDLNSHLPSWFAWLPSNCILALLAKFCSPAFTKSYSYAFAKVKCFRFENRTVEQYCPESPAIDENKEKGTDFWLQQPAKVSIAVVDCLSFIHCAKAA